MIRSMLDDVVTNLMVLPVRMIFKIYLSCDHRCAFQSPAGVARVKAVSRRNFHVQKGALRNDVPGVHSKMTLGKASPECTFWRHTRSVVEEMDFSSYKADPDV